MNAYLQDFLDDAIFNKKMKGEDFDVKDYIENYLQRHPIVTAAPYTEVVKELFAQQKYYEDPCTYQDAEYYVRMAAKADAFEEAIYAVQRIIDPTNKVPIK